MTTNKTSAQETVYDKRNILCRRMLLGNRAFLQTNKRRCGNGGWIRQWKYRITHIPGGLYRYYRIRIAFQIHDHRAAGINGVLIKSLDLFLSQNHVIRIFLKTCPESLIGHFSCYIRHILDFCRCCRQRKRQHRYYAQHQRRNSFPF